MRLLPFAYLLLLLCAAAKLPAQTKRPNIIFILTDDQRFDAISYVGNPLATTPEMDRLAREGTYFNHAMVTTPICAASRASILSGVYERSHRFDFSTGDIPERYLAQSYPAVLRQAGYRTGFYGKFGVKYGALDSLFDEYAYYDRSDDYPDRRGYFYKTIDGDTVHLTRYTGQQALDFVDRNAKTGQPFCLSLSFSAPHAHDIAKEQYFWQAETDSLLRDEDVPAPALAGQNYFDALPEAVRQGFNRQRWYWRFDTPEKYQHSVKGYYRMIAGIDLEIGKLRAKLAERGLDQNTVIIVMGDNGYFLGERQLAGKWLMYDNSVRVPLIVYDPRAEQHHDSDALALNIDVPATIVDLAGLAEPTSYQGKSLRPLVEGQTADLARDTVLLEHLWEFDHIPPSEGVRTREWKYLRYINDKRIEELYRLTDDPEETVNLALDTTYRAKLVAFRRKCDALGQAYGDDYSAGPIKLSHTAVDSSLRFSWSLPPDSGEQVAYQMLVASSVALLEDNVGDVWDSKRVVGDGTTDVAYAGPALEPGRVWYWKVRIWGAANRLTRYSEAAGR